MKKTLEVGHDYGAIFGLDKSKAQHMIYLGGISFKAVNGSQDRTADSQGTFDKISEYINRPSHQVGSLR